MGRSRAAAIAVLSLRVAYGAALVAAPGRVTRSWLGPAGGEPPAAVAVRGLGRRGIPENAPLATAVVTGASAAISAAVAVAVDR